MSKVLKTLNKVLGSSPRAAPRQRSRRNRRGRNRRVRRNRLRRYPVRTLPSAFVRTPVAKFSTRGVENGIMVTGCDLVYDIPDTIQQSSSKIFAVIPANPLYWLGTRIAGLANMYQNYRPLSFSVHYVPQVAVTQPGTVFMGTLWESTSSHSDLQQTLLTSNGGLATPCYSPATSNVRLKTNLSMNLYRLHETGTYDSVPFYFVAGLAGASVVPGYFFVTYKYVFKNAMGTSWYASARRVTLAQLPVPTSDGASSTDPVIPQINSSIVVLNSTQDSAGADVPAGTVLAVEKAESGMVLKENDSERVLPSDTQVMLYGTQPTDTTTSTSIARQFTSVLLTSALLLGSMDSGGDGTTGPVFRGVQMRASWDGSHSPSIEVMPQTGADYHYGRIVLPPLSSGSQRLVYFDFDISRYSGADFTSTFLVALKKGSRFTTSTVWSPPLTEDALVQIIVHPNSNYRISIRPHSSNIFEYQRSLSWTMMTRLVPTSFQVFSGAGLNSSSEIEEYRPTLDTAWDVIPFGNRNAEVYLNNSRAISPTDAITGQPDTELVTITVGATASQLSPVIPDPI